MLENQKSVWEYARAGRLVPCELEHSFARLREGRSVVDKLSRVLALQQGTR